MTQHYSSQSKTVSQLESSGTTSTSKFPQLSPSGLLKHLRTGSVQMPHHIMTTRMELSLCWPFYLKHGPGGYTVGTTAGLPVEIVEALAQ
jgi:hypothetical protein